MTTFLLIRHGDTDAVDKVLAGSAPGWRLNLRGKQQVERLADRLANIRLNAVYTSPLERAVETAGPIAQRHGLEPLPADALGEIRFGEWESLAFEDLDRHSEWRQFNTFRSSVRPPGGELMIEAQVRMIQQMECLRARHRDGIVALVTHADPLRAVLAHCLGISLDLIHRLTIRPASISVVQIDGWGLQVTCVNDTGGLAV